MSSARIASSERKNGNDLKEQLLSTPGPEATLAQHRANEAAQHGMRPFEHAGGAAQGGAPHGGALGPVALPDRRVSLCTDCLCSRRCCRLQRFRFLIMRKRWIKTLLSIWVTPLLLLVLVAIKAGTTTPGKDPVKVQPIFDILAGGAHSKLATRIWTFDQVMKENTICNRTEVGAIQNVSAFMKPDDITKCALNCVLPIPNPVAPRCNDALSGGRASLKAPFCSCLTKMQKYFMNFVQHGGTNFLLRCNIRCEHRLGRSSPPPSPPSPPSPYSAGCHTGGTG